MFEQVTVVLRAWWNPPPAKGKAFGISLEDEHMGRVDFIKLHRRKHLLQWTTIWWNIL